MEGPDYSSSNAVSPGATVHRRGRGGGNQHDRAGTTVDELERCHLIPAEATGNGYYHHSHFIEKLTASSIKPALSWAKPTHRGTTVPAGKVPGKNYPCKGSQCPGQPPALLARPLELPARAHLGTHDTVLNTVFIPPRGPSLSQKGQRQKPQKPPPRPLILYLPTTS